MAELVLEKPVCQRCQGDLIGRVSWAKYCLTCRKQLVRERERRKKKQHRQTCTKKRQPSLVGQLVSGDVGALAELLVCADLLRRGFAVFRAVSPSSPCDLLATNAAQVWRVEVKNAHYDPRLKEIKYTRRKGQHYDVLALVVDGERIVYRPEWPKVS